MQEICVLTPNQNTLLKKIQYLFEFFFFLVVTLHLSISMVCAQAAWKAARKITEFKCQYFGLLSDKA